MLRCDGTAAAELPERIQNLCRRAGQLMPQKTKAQVPLAVLRVYADHGAFVFGRGSIVGGGLCNLAGRPPRQAPRSAGSLCDVNDSNAPCEVPSDTTDNGQLATEPKP